jgi:hypothetical protein
MNIVQLHERVRFWIDAVASTRFNSQDIDNALNTAIDMKVLETYDQNRPMNKSDSFQRTQRCRDILGPIVAKAVNNNPAGFVLNTGTNTIVVPGTTNYLFLVSLGIKIGSTIYECIPLTYDRKNILYKNPFRKARMTPTVRMYYNELEGNIVITHAYTSTLTDFELYYIKTPAIVNYGIEYTLSHDFTIGNIVIAVEETVYNGVTYKIGEKITIVTNHLAITSGLVVYSYTECDLRSSSHEEISRRAAINCLITAGQGEKAKLLREEIIAL